MVAGFVFASGLIVAGAALLAAAPLLLLRGQLGPSVSSRPHDPAVDDLANHIARESDKTARMREEDPGRAK